MMGKETNNLFDIDQLAAEVASFVSNLGQASGRVSETPSRRTIRYYSQHGLLDPPVEFKGRKAFYGDRHVLQLVAIKQLQARGLSLSEVQATLMGVADERLRHLAGDQKPSKDDFWRRKPAELKPSEDVAPSASQSTVGEFAQLSGVRLDAHTVLMIEDLARDLHADDLDAIRVAAQPLLKLLQKRHLVR